MLRLHYSGIPIPNIRPLNKCYKTTWTISFQMKVNANMMALDEQYILFIACLFIKKTCFLFILYAK